MPQSSENQAELDKIEKALQGLADLLSGDALKAARDPLLAKRAALLKGSGQIVQGDKNVVLGKRAVRARNVRGDVVTGRKSVKAKKQAVAVGGDISNSTLITAQTVVIADRYWQAALQERLPQADLRPAIQAYLNYLLDRYRYLNFKGMGVADRVPLRLPLMDLFVPLRARLDQPEAEAHPDEVHLSGKKISSAKEKETPQAATRPLLELLQQNPGLIILGDPGAGKTTFLKYLALRLAGGGEEELGLGPRLPILVPISAYAQALAADDVRLDDFIAGYFHDIGADLPVGQMLTEALHSGTALILLDGLDEVKDMALRNTVTERLADFYTLHRRPGNKFVLTSRIIGYRQVRPSAEGLLECTLTDLSDSGIATFLERWTGALERQAQSDTALARADALQERTELLQAIQQNPGVRRLAGNPLLLTILTLMKRQGVTLPERRVELYEQYVRTLLSTWNRARSLSGRAPGRDLDVIRTLRILAPLALWMHQVSPGVGLVRRDELHRKLIELFDERGEAEPEQAATQFLADVGEHAALLLERGVNEYGFIHLTFEEYLAAVALAWSGQGDVSVILEQVQAHVGDQAWHEVILLSVGYIGLIQHLERPAGALVEALANEQPGPAGEAVILAGEAVLDASPGGVPLESKKQVITRLVPVMQSAALNPSLRLRAGLALGRLGWLPADLDDFIEIPPGDFLFGENKQVVNLPERYWIAKYPITNAQFTRFMQDGGYQRQELWSEAGWAWRKSIQYDDKTPILEDELAGQQPLLGRNQPYYWARSSLNNPIFPVVGVSWFEAQAYCNWLQVQALSLSIPAGYRVRLPSEQEWERAARGVDGRQYPWGEEFNPAFANTQESGLRSTTAVCTYLQGISPVGAWDMGGNTWEWTLARWENIDDARIVRSGSRMGSHPYASCTSRDWFIRSNFYTSVGFRVVIAPSNGA